MSLRIFFDPLQEEEIDELDKVNGVIDSVQLHTHEGMPSVKAADVAVFCFSEYSGPGQEKVPATDFAKLRKAFYSLKSFSKECKLIDLGFLRPGPNLEESYARLREVCEKLMEQNTLPLIIGGADDLGFAQYLAYQNFEKIISVVNVDARIDMGKTKSTNKGGHVYKILTHQPNYLFEYNHLAYQRYFVEPKTIEALQYLHYESKSVGQIRERIAETEPVIRSADMLSFDLSAIKAADVGAVLDKTPFGLTGEEACQLCWYGGMSEKLTSVGFYNYRPELDKDGQSAQVLATMVWYFVEGFSNRKEEYSFKSNFHIKYLVPLDTLHKSLVFYKSKLTDKWWMEAGLHDDAEKYYHRNAVIPCSYEDYQTAVKGQIPERWLKATGKQS
ncbi:formimidoylglutamase [Flammeovirgaceae bacterium SG7u.111]|nr:formimidoylglutamase [Flammeovirgaceae bacterium SG7u.132]WPO35578.1 formimidoylglutamase [Flammeovirgaceae bacterium SG7u.111]